MTRHDNDVAYCKILLQLVRKESQKKSPPHLGIAQMGTGAWAPWPN